MQDNVFIIKLAMDWIGDFGAGVCGGEEERTGTGTCTCITHASKPDYSHCIG